MKSSFNNNNAATIKSKQTLAKILFLRPVEQGQWPRCNVPIQRWLFSNNQQDLF